MKVFFSKLIVGKLSHKVNVWHSHAILHKQIVTNKNPTQMLTISTSSEQRVLLPNISWKLYENLLAKLGNQRSTKIAYHQGQLEIMVPLSEDENRNRLIDRPLR